MAKAPVTRAKKKRVARKKFDIAAVVAAVETVTVSKINKMAVTQFAKAEKALERANTAVATAQARVDKAKEAVASAKTPAAKAKQRERAATLGAALTKAKAAVRVVTAEKRTAERLVLALHKAHEKAYADYMKAYDRSAAAALAVPG